MVEEEGMKGIFLDVDGVLNTYFTVQTNPVGSIGICPDRVKILKRILSETGAKIILSTSWRQYKILEDHLWEALGADLKALHIGTTPDLSEMTEGGIWLAKTRGDEIAQWLSEHPEVTKFVIIDDFDHMKHLSRYLVQTNTNVGLTEALADSIIYRLNSHDRVS